MLDLQGEQIFDEGQMVSDLLSPLMVDSEVGDYEPIYSCALCGEYFEGEHYAICDHCGQHADW